MVSALARAATTASMIQLPESANAMIITTGSLKDVVTYQNFLERAARFGSILIIKLKLPLLISI